MSYITPLGYVQIYKPLHPNARSDGCVFEHTLIAEKALGRLLKQPECIHHIDEDRTNNTPSNLVICPNEKYHKLLHVRTAALNSCNNANYRKCKVCKEYDDPENMTKLKRSGNRSEVYRHKKCHAKAENRRKLNKILDTLEANESASSI